MSMYFERTVVDEYPGAGVIIPGDLSGEDCAEHPSMQALVLEISSGAGPGYATTIVGGLAYTEATTGNLETLCASPPEGIPGEMAGDVGGDPGKRIRRRRKRKDPGEV